MDFQWHDFSEEEPSFIDWQEIPPTPTYYERLQVTPSATPEVIKGAYRALVMKYHPDRLAPENRTEGEEIVKALNEAYEVLSDLNSRADYDRQIGIT